MSNSGSCYHTEAGSIMGGNGTPLSRDQATHRRQNHREGCLKERGREPRRARARKRNVLAPPTSHPLLSCSGLQLVPALGPSQHSLQPAAGSC